MCKWLKMLCTPGWFLRFWLKVSCRVTFMLVTSARGVGDGYRETNWWWKVGCGMIS
jgi:hypothetical protein